MDSARYVAVTLTLAEFHVLLLITRDLNNAKIPTSNRAYNVIVVKI